MNTTRQFLLFFIQLYLEVLNYTHIMPTDLQNVPDILSGFPFVCLDV